MIIQHNIPAINSHRQLGINNRNLANNLEKLSSGYRINRAADDAAGLAISEKMRSQITGLDRAILNAQDGASLIQTAEGALQEVHSMLNRMVELATQSANGTIQTSDRYKVEAETQALKDEIDRISKATNFNGIELLDGSLSKTTPQDVVVNGVRVSEYAAKAGQYTAASVGTIGATAWGTSNQAEYTVSLDNGDAFTMRFKLSDDKSKMISLDTGTVYNLATDTGAVNATELGRALESELMKTKLKDDYIISANNGALTFTNRVAGTKPPKIAGMTSNFDNQGPNTIAVAVVANHAPQDEERFLTLADFETFKVIGVNNTNEDTAVFEINGQKFALVDFNANATGDSDGALYEKYVQQLENRGVNIIKVDNRAWTDAAGLKKKINHIASEINQKTGLGLKYAAAEAAAVPPKAERLVLKGKAGQGNGLTMQVGDTAEAFNKITVSVDDMSSAGLGIQNITMNSQESADRALERINAAIEKVSVNRGNLGALQNRLTYTINNLGVTTENMTAAESRIRDVDMAKEMMNFTKNNVLAQAAQSMLAQANMQPQQVLQLLR